MPKLPKYLILIITCIILAGAGIWYTLSGNLYEEGIEKLRTKLHDKNPHIRERALFALGELPSLDRDRLSTIWRLSDDDVPYVQATAAWAAVKAGASMKDVIDAVYWNGISRNSPELYRYLGGRYTDLDKTLLEKLSGGDSRIRLSAMLILAKQNKVPVEAVGALTESLDDKDPRIRFGAGILLTKIGPDAASAVPALLHALNDRDPAVRYSTVYALDAIKSSPDKVVPAFIGILRHEGESVLVRKTVIRGLGDFGAGARDAVPVLTDLLTSSTTSIVIASARALGAIGAPAASALPELHKAAERNIEEYAKSVVGDAIKAIELDMGEEE